MRAARILLALGLLLGSCGGTPRADCDERVRFAEWRAGGQVESEDAEDTRREVAAHLVECDTLTGRSKQDVQRLLGPPGERAAEPGGRTAWDYYLGPDGLNLDSETMLVTFGPDDRVVSVEQTQG